MLKKILKLDGTKELSKKEQKHINGGARFYCTTNKQCQNYYDEQAVVCVRNSCILL